MSDWSNTLRYRREVCTDYAGCMRFVQVNEVITVTPEVIEVEEGQIDPFGETRGGEGDDLLDDLEDDDDEDIFDDDERI